MNTKKVLNIFLVLILFLSITLPINTYAIETGTVSSDNGKLSVEVNMDDSNIKDSREADTNIINETFINYKEFIVFVGGLATITMVGIFIWNFVKLCGLGTEHWIVRRSCVIGMLWSGLAAALLGSGTLLFAFFYNMFG